MTSQSMKKTQSTKAQFFGILNRSRAAMTPVREEQDRVLFLCTGNYYRSRMAEEIFNHYAQQEGLPFRAFSRGIAHIFHMLGNVGPMSPFGIEGLSHLGIQPRNSTSFPRHLSQRDLRSATTIIALHKSEHEPMIRKRFPQVAGRVIYWDIPDVGEMPVKEAAMTIQRNVLELIDGLKNVS